MFAYIAFWVSIEDLKLKFLLVRHFFLKLVFKSETVHISLLI